MGKSSTARIENDRLSDKMIKREKNENITGKKCIKYTAVKC